MLEIFLAVHVFDESERRKLQAGTRNREEKRAQESDGLLLVSYGRIAHTVLAKESLMGCAFGSTSLSFSESESP